MLNPRNNWSSPALIQPIGALERILRHQESVRFVDQREGSL